MSRNTRWSIEIVVAAAVLMLLQELVYNRAGQPWWAAVLLSLLALAAFLWTGLLWRRRGRH